MSHNGPVGPAGNSARFTETFPNDSVFDSSFYNGGLKLLLINYGTRGDVIAVDDLLTAAMKCERLEFKAVNARYVTPTFMRDHLNDRWCVVVNPGNSNYVGSACMYDGEGRHYGWRGGPGCRGFNGFPDPTRVHYQQDDVASDKIIVSSKEGSSVEHLGNLMENCAFFDKPNEIHVVFPDDHKYVNLTYQLRDKVREHFKGPVKLVSYADSLLTNHRDELKIVYVALAAARRGHRFDYEQYRERKMARKHDGSYVWSRDSGLAEVKPETFGQRMDRLGISGGFRRGELVMLSTPGPRILDLGPSGVIETPAPLWTGNTSSACKRPKGPITMPGLGERKKKGKHKTKWS